MFDTAIVILSCVFAVISFFGLIHYIMTRDKRPGRLIITEYINLINSVSNDREELKKAYFKLLGELSDFVDNNRDSLAFDIAHTVADNVNCAGALCDVIKDNPVAKQDFSFNPNCLYQALKYNTTPVKLK